MVILAIDPGSAKCGVAVVRSQGAAIDTLEIIYSVHWRGIVPTAEMTAQLNLLFDEHDIESIVVGDATTSKKIRDVLEQQWPQMPIVVIDEVGSTLEARPLYWKAVPPTGWRRLLPLSLQTPPRPIDDYAAEVLALRFFKTHGINGQ